MRRRSSCAAKGKTLGRRNDRNAADDIPQAFCQRATEDHGALRADRAGHDFLGAHKHYATEVLTISSDSRNERGHARRF